MTVATNMVKVKTRKLKSGQNWMVLFDKGLSWCFVDGRKNGRFRTKIEAEQSARNLSGLHLLQIIEVRKTTAKIDREIKRHENFEAGCRFWLDDNGSVLMVKNKEYMYNSKMKLEI